MSARTQAECKDKLAKAIRDNQGIPVNPILFPSPRTGGCWSPDAVSRINRKLLAKAGIEERVRFQDLRHTFATMALSGGVDVKTLSSMLGHYSAGFTLDIYYAHYQRYAERCGGKDRRLHGNGDCQVGTGAA